MSQVTSAAPLNAAVAGTGAAGFAGAGVTAAAGTGLEGGATAAPALSSSRRIGDPCETLSPSLMRNSFTIPACGDGISIVALSDSSVTREVSFSTLSPGFTSTSMISTSLKSPMSGTLTSIICATPASQKGAANVGEDRGQIGREARPGGAVDDAVVVRKRQRQHQPRNERAVLVHRPHLRSRHAEDRDFGRVDDRRERRAADAPEAGDAEGTAAHAVGLELLLPCEFGDFRQLAGKIEDALAVRVADHGHDQAIGRVHRDADVVVLLDDQVLAGLVERSVEIGKLAQGVDRSLHQEGEHGELEAFFFRHLRVLLAESLELGDVGFVVLGDVRNRDPVAVQKTAREFLDARQGLRFDRTE